MGTEDAKKIVDKVADFGATFFGITGGQPFLRKDLFEVLDYATEKGLSTSIITDGRLLDEEAFKKIVKNQTKISVSIDGAEKTNDAIRGKGAYKAAVSAIERFSKEKLLNCLVYTFANAGQTTNVNEADMRHVLDLAKKYDARWVVFHGMIPYSSDKACLKADPTPAQYEWVCNKLYDLTPEYNGKPGINVYIPFYARVAKQRGMPDFDNWYNNFFLGRCFFGKFMSVAENGEVIPCSYNDAYRVGNIKDKSLKADLGRNAEQRILQQSQRQSQHQGQMRRLRIQRTLRRLPISSIILHRRHPWVRPKMRLCSGSIKTRNKRLMSN